MFKSTFKFMNRLNKNFLLRNFSTYENIKINKEHTGVGIIQLNRPKAKNALNNELMKEMNDALNEFDQDKQIGCIILSGEETYFAAGADIKFMKDLDYAYVYENHFLDHWNFITTVK